MPETHQKRRDGVDSATGRENGVNGVTGRENGVNGVTPSRGRPAKKPVVFHNSRSPLVFVTVCTKNRKRILDRPDAHRLLVAAWNRARRWLVGRYMIMPHHIHLFASPATYPPESIGLWAKYWKTVVSREWPWREEQPIWQQYLWDTQLRRGEHYASKWEYVRRNPVRSGLAASSEDWPYQGELNVLQWHD